MMRCVVLASNEQERLAGFAAGLARIGDVEIIQVDTAAAALDVAQREPVDLVVVGEVLIDMDPVACVTEIVRLNPVINCAMVSAMAADEFHAATEGLGVLMQLPPDPSGEDAAAMMRTVEALSALLDPEPIQAARP